MKNRSVKVMTVPTSRDAPEKSPSLLCDSPTCVKLGKLLGGTPRNMNYKNVREKLCDGCETPLAWC